MGGIWVKRVIGQLEGWLVNADKVLDEMDVMTKRLQESDKTTASNQEEFDAAVQEMIKKMESSKVEKGEKKVGKRVRK